MNTGDGEFVCFSGVLPKMSAAAEVMAGRTRKHDLFKVGEEVHIKRSRFQVHSIGNKFMTLRLLPGLLDVEEKDADDDKVE